jgi:hypothetical protein
VAYKCIGHLSRELCWLLTAILLIAIFFATTDADETVCKSESFEYLPEGQQECNPFASNFSSSHVPRPQCATFNESPQCQQVHHPHPLHLAVHACTVAALSCFNRLVLSLLVQTLKLRTGQKPADNSRREAKSIQYHSKDKAQRHHHGNRIMNFQLN